MTSPPPVLMNDFKAQWADVGKEVLATTARVGESGWLILGKEVEAFEEAFSRYAGLPEVIGFGNCLDATEMALRALQITPGSAVLTTPLTAFATTLAIIRAGGHPVYIDVDASGQMDLALARDFLEKNPAARTAVPVHLFGHSGDLAALGTLRDDFELALVEDCAQAVGATSRGIPTGSIGQIAATSFYPTKNLGCYGDGGAAFTQDPALAALLRSLRDYGQTEKYVHSHIGGNSRLDELQAAILHDALLPRLPAATARRRAIAAAYREGITHPAIAIPPAPAGSESVYHLFPTLISGVGRESLAAHLREAGIGTGVHYPILMPDQPAMKNVPHTLGSPLTTAKQFAREELSLPIHPYLDDASVSRVIDTCNCWPT